MFATSNPQTQGAPQQVSAAHVSDGVVLSFYHSIIELDGVLFGHAQASTSAEINRFFERVQRCEKPVRLVSHCDAQTALLVRNAALTTKNVAGIAFYRSSSLSQQHASLSQALSATMREAASGDLIILFSSGSQHGFKDSVELHEAFSRLIQYFGAVLGTSCPR